MRTAFFMPGNAHMKIVKRQEVLAMSHYMELMMW